MGSLLALMSAFLHASKDLVSKRVSQEIHPATSTFASFAFALPFYLIAILISWSLGFETLRWSTTFVCLVILRTCSDAGAEWFKMKAIAEEEISFVAPILSLVPLSLLVVSPLITGDIPSQWGVVGVLVSVSGSVLLIDRKPQSDVDKARRRRAIVFSLIAVFCFSLNASFDRLAVKESSPLLSGGAMTLLATLFFLPTVWGRRDRYQEIRGAVKHLFLRGLFEITFMTLKLSALIFLQAPYVLALARTSLLLSIIGGRVLFKDHDFKRRIWAGVLITLGILTILFER